MPAAANPSTKAAILSKATFPNIFTNGPLPTAFLATRMSATAPPNQQSTASHGWRYTSANANVLASIERKIIGWWNPGGF